MEPSFGPRRVQMFTDLDDIEIDVATLKLELQGIDKGPFATRVEAIEDGLQELTLLRGRLVGGFRARRHESPAPTPGRRWR